jgi:hypothetical protein
VSADADGFELDVEGEDPRRLAYADIDRARTVFVWGPEPRGQAKTSPSNRTTRSVQPKTTDKRKQVVNP